MPGGRRRQPSARWRLRAAILALAPRPDPGSPPGEPAQMVQGGGPRGGTRGACAERRLLSRGRTPLSHLPDKHHENSAAHTVIAAPAAGRVSTSPFPRGVNHFILWRPLFLPPSIFPSITVFSNESVLCIRWPKYWSFSFSISSSNKYSGLISFRIDWLDPLAVQGTLKLTLICYTPIQNKKFKKRMGMFEEERAEKSELQWRERKPQKLWAG